MAKTLEQLAEMMKDVDFAMLSTHSEGGTIAARPMSNNRDVDYDGDNWFFACEDTRLIADLKANAQVGLAFHGKGGLLGMKPVFVHVEGVAELIHDKAAFEDHWTKGLSLWFKEGVDTPGLVLIKVHGVRAHYWDGEDQGEIVLEGVAV
ncbi:general stress protein 26 [Sphingomonas kyeonggiensis]|uniref:General stress protein 26 n=1 Tax=Sphingomonas kyeonggiensis TaxID=1268553 RepID=A0A7W7NQG6_9SPHN|nr:pyridoxamine 5'-phosphate oxidase family protein [Sphingomonas kyeonggiensis]MBB4838145.1 general stress protein 26 [Sphingomonas kyeonggiensis]